MEYYPRDGHLLERHLTPDLQLLHLNGLVGCHKGADGFWNNLNLLEGVSASEILQRVDDSDNEEIFLSFGWRNEANDKPLSYVEKGLDNMLRDVDYLVVVGYSFPQDNRVVDKMIFQRLGGKLKGIFYQDPNGSAQKIAAWFRVPIELIEIEREAVRFLTPNDLYPLKNEGGGIIAYSGMNEN